MLLSQNQRPGFQNGCSQAANTCAFVLCKIYFAKLRDEQDLSHKAPPYPQHLGKL